MKVSCVSVILISLLIVLSVTVVSAAELQDTTIDYTDYREVSQNSEAAIYKIKITNTGNTPQNYEILPDSDAVKQVGTYLIDPSTTMELMPWESQTFILHVYIENSVNGRASMPIEIRSGNASKILELSARPTTQQTNSDMNWVRTALRIAFYTLLILIIISLIINTFRKNKEKEKDDEDKPEVETYY